MPIKSLADIQADLAKQSAAQAKSSAQTMAGANSPGSWTQYMQPTGGFGSMFSSPQDMARQRQQSAMSDMANQANQAQYAIGDNDPTRSPTAALDRIIGSGEDVYANAANNQTDKMLSDFLSARVKGNDNPYNAQTINALQTGAANQSAAAEMANNKAAQDSLESRGFTAKDPAYQAAMMANQTQRQAANQDASLAINQQANLANYNARGAAAAQANQVNRGQQQAQQNAAQMLQSNYNQVSMADRNKPTAWRAPTWSAFQQQTQGQKPATFNS